MIRHFAHHPRLGHIHCRQWEYSRLAYESELPFPEYWDLLWYYMTLLIIIAPAAPATAPSRRRSFCPPRLLFCLGGDSQTFLLPRLLLRRVRPLNVKPDTVLPSLLPTADTDSGKSASSESSAARAASWSWSDSCRQSRGARGRSARTRRAAAQCCCRRASARWAARPRGWGARKRSSGCRRGSAQLSSVYKIVT